MERTEGEGGDNSYGFKEEKGEKEGKSEKGGGGGRTKKGRGCLVNGKDNIQNQWWDVSSVGHTRRYDDVLTA